MYIRSIVKDSEEALYGSAFEKTVRGSCPRVVVCSCVWIAPILGLGFVLSFHLPLCVRVTEESPEEIARYLEERRKKYPTKANVQEKVSHSSVQYPAGEVSVVLIFAICADRELGETQAARGARRCAF